jgi:hypothetical protein
MKGLLVLLLFVFATVDAWADSWGREPASDTALAAPVPQHALPQENPTVRASRQAQVPGDLRPERPVIPQVSIPIRRAGTMKPQNRLKSTPTTSSIDDSVARCRAMASAQEREECERELDEAAGPGPR